MQKFRISDSNNKKAKIQNFWSPQEHRKKLQNFWSPEDTGKNSEFLISARTEKKIQKFWTPTDKGKNSEFLIPPITQANIQNFSSPQEDRKKFRISDPLRIHRQQLRTPDSPNNTGKSSAFLSPPRKKAKIQNFWSPNNI